MKARPILMHARSVQNLLAGRKTQTRRICKFKVCSNGFHFDGNEILCHVDELPPATMLMEVVRGKDRYWNSQLEGWEGECPYGQPGDLLWVREAWGAHSTFNALPPRALPQKARLFYRADAGYFPSASKKRHARHMPRWASRLTLVLTDVRVERVQDIRTDDCFDEGIERHMRAGVNGEEYADGGDDGWITPQHAFQILWDDTNGPGAWERNDWCWALTFEVLRENVDRVLERAKAAA